MKSKTLKRELATLYYTDLRGGLPVSTGACKLDAKFGEQTLKGSGWKRAASLQLFVAERFKRVEVVDRRTGEIVCVLRRTGEGGIDPSYDAAGKEAKNYHWREKMKLATAAKRRIATAAKRGGARRGRK